MLRAGIKRLSALAFAVLTLSLTLSAAGITEKPGKEFFVYGDKQSNEKIAEILGETTDTLDNYCYNNGIIYLAINEKNTKQIRVTENSTAFSESVGELTGLSDDKIAALAPEIAGSGFHTETVTQKSGRKFIKATALSEDSGGKFTLIQYITVTSKKKYIISIYTAAGENTDYAEKVFSSFSFGNVAVKKPEKKPYGYIFMALTAIFALFGAYIVYTLIRDIRADRAEATEEKKDDNI